MSEPDRFLPLKSAWLHILLAVASGHRHGYAIRREVERLTQGKVRLWPATLYGALDRLCSDDLLAESTTEADRTGRPRRTYELTPLGTTVLQAEASRLEELVELARAQASLKTTGVRS